MSSFKPNCYKVFPRRKPGVTPAPKGALSIYDPIYLGVDTRGKAVYVTLMYRNILDRRRTRRRKVRCTGQHRLARRTVHRRGTWSSSTARSLNCCPYAPVAEEFVGNDMTKALRVLRKLQADLNERYLHLARTGCKKITADDGYRAKLVAIDELAYFTVTVGTKEQQEEFRTLVRDIVARGRAAGIIVVAATQRPSADIVPTSLRDLFGYRLAFRCATDSSSDIILGTGWAPKVYTAVDIEPEALGVGLLRAEGGFPRRLKTAYLNDRHVNQIVRRAAHLRRAA